MRKLICSHCFKIIVSIIFLLVLLTQCINNIPAPVITNNAGEQFAGNKACKSCHANIYNSFTQTAHNLTSAPGMKEFIKGNIEPGNNVFYYSPYDRVIMEDRDSGLYQAS